VQSLSRPTLALLPFLAVGALACAPQSAAAGDFQESEEGTVQKREIPPIRTTFVERREMLRLLETTSKLESEFEIQLFPRASGEVVSVLVEEGDRVKAGDVLARMDERDERLAVRDAEVALSEAKTTLELLKLSVEDARELRKSSEKAARQAERDYERDRRLVEEAEFASPVSVQALEGKELARDQARHEKTQREIGFRRANAEVQAQENAISRASVALERAHLTASFKEVRAPFDGVIAMRNVRAGDMVSSAAAAFTLTDVDNLRAVFTRPQEELGLFHHARSTRNGDGQPDADAHRLEIFATAEAYPGQDFHGWVERISPTIEADSGQFRVTARIASNDDSQLLPGMLIRMRIVTDRHPDALVVPKRALRREGSRRYVLKVIPAPETDETAETAEELRSLVRVEVSESYTDEDHVEVLPAVDGSLAPGDEIVFIGSRDLTEDQTVRLDRPDDETVSLVRLGEAEDEAVEPAEGGGDEDASEN